MLWEDQALEAIGATAHGDDGEKIGKVGQPVPGRPDPAQPEFVTVNTGFFGTSESSVPVADATFNGDRPRGSPFSKDKVKDAPNVDLDVRHLDESEEQRLYEYHGLSSSRHVRVHRHGHDACRVRRTTRTTDTDCDITSAPRGTTPRDRPPMTR